ncbi:BnaC06g15770D [Brassica napus]|uniref:BnaC06g15770D protein n=1 Tax=Brassica napus TaxID=3708 RepID=A0A078H3L0_BRANA|nr:BnaC06g15770D [Brassica napus]
MFRCGVFREVEACSDPLSPALAYGKGVSSRFAFAGFWLRRAEASKAPRCRLGTRCSFGLRLLGLICVKFGVVVVKVGLGYCG